jgi:hypothetical protein
LAISQSEAEEKERQKKMLTQKYAMSSFLSAPTNNTPPVIRKNSREKYELISSRVFRKIIMNMLN